MLVINPDECIDCGVCEPECPVDAIKPETAEGMESWIALNKKYSEAWPRITEKSTVPADADRWKNEPNKLELFSPNPASRK